MRTIIWILGVKYLELAYEYTSWIGAIIILAFCMWTDYRIYYKGDSQ